MFDREKWELLPDGSRRRIRRDVSTTGVVEAKSEPAAKQEQAPETKPQEQQVVVEKEVTLETEAPASEGYTKEEDESEQTKAPEATAAAAARAEELGLPLDSIVGTGVGGKVTKDDVEKAAQ